MYCGYHTKHTAEVEHSQESLTEAWRAAHKITLENKTSDLDPDYWLHHGPHGIEGAMIGIQARMSRTKNSLPTAGYGRRSIVHQTT